MNRIAVVCSERLEMLKADVEVYAIYKFDKMHEIKHLTSGRSNPLCKFIHHICSEEKDTFYIIDFDSESNFADCFDRIFLTNNMKAYYEALETCWMLYRALYIKMDFFVKNRIEAHKYAQRHQYSDEIVEYLRSCITIDKELMRIADIGCGTSELGKKLSKYGHKIWGIDPDPNMLNSITADRNDIHRVLGTDCRTNIPDSSMDYVIVAQTLHRFDVKGFRAECDRVLKQKNHIVVLWQTYAFSDLILKKVLNAFLLYFPKFLLRSASLQEELNGNEMQVVALLRHHYKKKTIFEHQYFHREEFVSLCSHVAFFPVDHILKNEVGSLAIYENYTNYQQELEQIFTQFQEDGKVILRKKVDIFFGE